MGIAFDNPSAFEPMFGDSVRVVAERPGGRTIRGTFRASVMPISFVDPFAESDAQTVISRFSVLIANHGEGAWIEAAIGSRPQIGDEVTLVDGFKTKVTKVSPLVGEWWELEAREC